MPEYICCRSCDSPSCKGCNIYTLSTMLNKGKFDSLMNDNRSINPTADVAEIIRCKDCKHYEKHKPIHNTVCERCNGYLIPMKPDDFCSYGERKTDD